MFRVHLGSMSGSIKSIIQQNPNMKRVEVFVLNVLFNGVLIYLTLPLLPQFLMMMDRFCSLQHHADTMPISGEKPLDQHPDSQTIEEEGVLIDNFKLVENGKFRWQETKEL